RLIELRLVNAVSRRFTPLGLLAVKFDLDEQPIRAMFPVIDQQGMLVAVTVGEVLNHIGADLFYRNLHDRLHFVWQHAVYHIHAPGIGILFEPETGRFSVVRYPGMSKGDYATLHAFYMALDPDIENDG